MKTIWILFLYAELALIAVSCNNNSDKIIGEWSGIYNGNTTKMIFDKSNNVFIVDGNKALGGPDFVIYGHNAELKYRLDYTKNPIWFDLIVHIKENPEKDIKFKGILKYLTDTKIQYRINFTPNGNRPDNFDYEDDSNTVILDRKSE